MKVEQAARPAPPTAVEGARTGRGWGEAEEAETAGRTAGAKELLWLAVAAVEEEVEGRLAGETGLGTAADAAAAALFAGGAPTAVEDGGGCAEGPLTTVRVAGLTPAPFVGEADAAAAAAALGCCVYALLL